MAVGFRLCASGGGRMSRSLAAKRSARTTREEVAKLLQSQEYKHWRMRKAIFDPRTLLATISFLYWTILLFTKDTSGIPNIAETESAAALEAAEFQISELKRELVRLTGENSALSDQLGASEERRAMEGGEELRAMEDDLLKQRTEYQHAQTSMHRLLRVLAFMTMALSLSSFLAVFFQKAKSKFQDMLFKRQIEFEGLFNQNAALKRELRAQTEKWPSEKNARCHEQSEVSSTLTRMELELESALGRIEELQRLKNMHKKHCRILQNKVSSVKLVMLKINVQADPPAPPQSQQTNEALRSELVMLRAHLEQERSQKREVSRQLSSAVQERNAARRENSALARRVVHLQTELDRIDPMSDPEVQRVIQECQEALKKETAQKEHLKSDLSSLRSTVANLESDKEKCEKATKDQVGMLQDQLGQMTEEMDALRQQCGQMRRELEETRAVQEVASSSTNNQENSVSRDDLKRRLLAAIQHQHHLAGMVKPMEGQQ